MNQEEYLSGARALARLVDVALAHQGHSTVPIAELIIGLWNPEYARPDAYLLCCRLDRKHFDDVLTVMRWFRHASSVGDLDRHVPDGERKMLCLMKRFGLGPDEILDNLDRAGRYVGRP